MPDPTLKKRLLDLIKTWIPMIEVADLTPRAQPLSDIGRLDVDQIHVVITAAQGGDTRELFALYRDVISADNHLQMDLGIRKLALLGDPFSVEPVDKKNTDDVAAAAAVKAGWTDARASWARARTCSTRFCSRSRWCRRCTGQSAAGTSWRRCCPWTPSCSISPPARCGSATPITAAIRWAQRNCQTRAAISSTAGICSARRMPGADQCAHPVLVVARLDGSRVVVDVPRPIRDAVYRRQVSDG